jgi:endonuclease/exonuclease/phosphatase family metal-dependent hydrolase
MGGNYIIRSLLKAVLTLAIFLMAACGSGQGLPSTSLTAATLNMFIGFDIMSLLEGDIELSDQAEVNATADGFLDEINACESSTRFSTMAKEIVDIDADIVGLQEALLFKMGGTTVHDFAGDLITAIEQQSQTTYQSLALTSFSILFPYAIDGETVLAKAIEREVLLFKEGITCTAIDEGKIFDTARIPVSVLGFSITYTRGVLAATCDLPGGQSISVYTTHLESDSVPEIQEDQAAELIEYINATASDPTLLLGDFNVFESGGEMATYSLITTDGFDDAFRTVNADPVEQPGYTCCQQEDFSNATSEVNRRFDYIFSRGNTISPTSSGLFCDTLIDRMEGEGTMWPTDHSGVWATFTLE